MFDYYLRNSGMALAGTIVGGLIGWAALLAESWAIGAINLVDPVPPHTIEEFCRHLINLGDVYLLLAVAMVVIWHVGALLSSGLPSPGVYSHGRSGSWRGGWILLLLASVGSVSFLWWLAGMGLFPSDYSVVAVRSELGRILSQTTGVFNNIVTFWLGTVAWTSSTHKYDPIGAARLRSIFAL